MLNQLRDAIDMRQALLLAAGIALIVAGARILLAVINSERRGEPYLGSIDDIPDPLKAGPGEDPPNFDELECSYAIVDPENHPERTPCGCEA